MEADIVDTVPIGWEVDFADDLLGLVGDCTALSPSRLASTERAHGCLRLTTLSTVSLQAPVALQRAGERATAGVRKAAAGGSPAGRLPTQRAPAPQTSLAGRQRNLSSCSIERNHSAFGRAASQRHRFPLNLGN